MSSAPRGKAWASDEDWQQHRDLITRLWWDEDKPLKEVQGYMAEKHDFHASDKMYKGRLKAWNLLKNLKSKDAEQIMGMAKTGAASGPLVIRGRKMGSKKWQKRLNRVVAPEDKNTSLVQNRKRNIGFTLPLPEHLAAPDTLRLTQAGLDAIRDFTDMQFTTRAWDLSNLPYDFDHDKTDQWSNGLLIATQKLRQDRGSESNFALINKSFDQYSAVVDQATPNLVPCTLSSIINLLPVGPGIADSLLRYTAGLANIKLGQYHPLSRLLSQLEILGAAQMALIARPILSAYFDFIVNKSHPANRWRSAVYPTYAKHMQQWGALPGDQVTTVFGDTIKGIEASLSALDPSLVDSSLFDQMDRHLHEVKIYFAVYLHDMKRFTEADEVLDAMDLWLRAGGADKNPEQFEQWLRIKGKVLVGLGRLTEATPYFIQTFEARRDRLGHKNRRTTRAIVELEEHYRSLDDTEAAEKWHKEFEESMSDA